MLHAHYGLIGDAILQPLPKETRQTHENCLNSKLYFIVEKNRMNIIKRGFVHEKGRIMYVFRMKTAFGKVNGNRVTALAKRVLKEGSFGGSGPRLCLWSDLLDFA